ncbi:hypothetical protein [Longispora albida]|uniref:hypothetical protein n=1 Tax=Longispora albida TaxID=203523 RepID=UPI00036288D1|nr:hypothetical protein [Longispora albida]
MLSSLVRVARLPHVGAVAGFSLLARLPKGIAPLAVVLLEHHRSGSYAAGGLAVAALAIGDAVTTPVQGLLIDRLGRAAVLLPSAAVYVLALAGLVAAPGLLAAVLCAFAAGAGFPPISGSMKAAWPVLVTDRSLLRAAYAFESLIQQVLLLAGPIVVAGLTAAASPAAAVLAGAGAAALGTGGFVLAAGRAGQSRRVTAVSRGLALRVREVRILVLATGVQGLVFGALPVAVPAAVGSATVAAVVLSVWIGGGLLGTLIPARSSYARLMAGFAVALVPVALVPGTFLALPLGIAGLFLTPIAATSYLVIDTVAPPENRTEAFTWLSTALAAGLAGGSALAGVLADHGGPLAALVIPAASAAVAALICARRL